MMADEEAFYEYYEEILHKQAQNEYIQQIWQIIYELEEDYKKSPNNEKMMCIWLNYRDINKIPPEWLLRELDKYVRTKVAYESKRKTKGGHQMGSLDYLRLSIGNLPQTTLDEYADREKISKDTARHRFKVAKGKWGAFVDDMKKRKREKT